MPLSINKTASQDVYKRQALFIDIQLDAALNHIGRVLDRPLPGKVGLHFLTNNAGDVLIIAGDLVGAVDNLHQLIRLLLGHGVQDVYKRQRQSCASKKFICGEPIKPPTKRLAGW